MKNNQPKNNWEERFNKEFARINQDPNLGFKEMNRELKQFISQIIAEEKAKVLDSLEKRLRNMGWIKKDPKIMGGTECIKGTRLPIINLIQEKLIKNI